MRNDIHACRHIMYSCIMCWGMHVTHTGRKICQPKSWTYVCMCVCVCVHVCMCVCMVHVYTHAIMDIVHTCEYYACTVCMHILQGNYECIICMHNMHAHYACTLCTHTTHALYDCIHAGILRCMLCIQIMHA